MDKKLADRKRHKHHGHGVEHRPDFVRMTSMKGHRDDDPYDMSFIKAVSRNVAETSDRHRTSMGADLKSALKRMRSTLKLSTKTSNILTESSENDIDIPFEDDDFTIDGENDDSYHEDQRAGETGQ